MDEPAYVKLHQSGKLREIARQLYDIYENCTLCPRMCKVNRLNGETGVCSGSHWVKISSVHPHFGEERPLVGRRGSGTIFLTNCNLRCIFCQNWDISHSGDGYEISDEELAGEMLRMQKSGCHNINFVSPTHYLPNIVQAIEHAVEKGLHLPIVYNTGSYDRVEILQMLEGIVDIYLPDFKFADEAVAAKYAPGAGDYPTVAKAALKEMHRQVGILQTDENNIAVKGLMIRHLVMPEEQAGTKEFAKFVAQELDPGTYVNIMAQYHPAYKANLHPGLSRRITTAEYKEAMQAARDAGLFNLD